MRTKTGPGHRTHNSVSGSDSRSATGSRYKSNANSIANRFSDINAFPYPDARA